MLLRPSFLSLLIECLVLGFCLSLKEVFAGYSCHSNPCLHGVCVDTLNSSYSCYCEDGYTGVMCQTDWDECWSSPCLNGASCIDGVAEYTCSCASGFEGPRCEEDVNECLSSPCQHGGSCRDGVDGYVCFCAPGWEGVHCEVDMPVCNVSNVELCRHGGQCVDGPGLQFSCLCQPGWSGQTCQAPVDECASNPCMNGAVCIDLEAAWACACPEGFTGKRCETSLQPCQVSPCMHDAICLMEENGPRCYCVPDFHGTFCEFQYDECLLGHSCLFGGTCIDGVDSYSCLCPSGRAGSRCEEEEPETTTSELDISTTQTSEFTETEPEEPITSTTTITTITTTEIPIITELSTEVIISSEDPKGISTTDLTTETNLTEFSTESPETSTFSTEFISIKTIVTTEPTLISTTSEEVEPRSISNTSTETSTNGFISEIITEFENITETTMKTFTEIPTSFINDTTTQSEPPVSVTETEIDTTVFTEAISTTEPFDERQWSVSLNGDGFVAHRLEASESWRVAVSLRTLHGSGLVFAMLRSDGPPTSRFLTVALSDGRLAVRWSCGVQSMAFTEVRTRVDTGDEVRLEAALWTDPISRRCRASLAVNGTHAMSGQQQTSYQQMTFPPSGWLYLGGLSNSMSEIPGFEFSEQQFIGCLSALRIDGEIVHIIEGAAASQGSLVPCAPPVCLQRPCAFGGTCLADSSSEQGWRCACPPGRRGPRCRGHVCSDNPCLHGGTCAPAAGVAFVCICVLGRHGLLCEHELQVTEPQFGPSVGALSAFAAYPVPWAEGSSPQGLEITVTLIPANDEQIGLVLFTGGLSGDHLALSFIQGVFALTWDLGSGPRRIFTSSALPTRPHGTQIQVRLGIHGRRGWLQVQGMGNVTGRAPGNASALDASPLLYLGGHEAPAFSALPHDLPLHRGFQGCIVSAEVRVGWGAKPWSLLGGSAVRGRGVAQCGTAPCPAHACSNGGACLPVGASFACLCPAGWYGPVCAQEYDPCEPSPCQESGTCLSLPDGPQCDCLPGRTGLLCEQPDIPSNDSIGFTGQRSFLAISLTENFQEEEFWLSLEIRSASLSGMIIFWRGWGVLAIHGGVLEMRIAEGTLMRPLIVRGARVLAADQWHQIEIRLYGRQVSLTVDGAQSRGLMPPLFRAPFPRGTLFLGGIPDFARIPGDSPSGATQPFRGCIRALMIGGREFPFWQGNETIGRNIQSCHLEISRKGCPVEPCANGGKCVAHVCRCIRGFIGRRCSERTSAARLKKHGYLELRPPPESSSLIEPVAKMRAAHVQLNFSTADATMGSAMLLWAEHTNWTLGLGLCEGKVKLVLGDDSELIPMANEEDPADGAWHEMSISLGPPRLRLSLDQHILLDRPMITGSEWRPVAALFGGVPGGQAVRSITRGHFDRGFRGCLQRITWGSWSPKPATLPGLNVESCPFA